MGWVMGGVPVQGQGAFRMHVARSVQPFLQEASIILPKASSHHALQTLDFAQTMDLRKNVFD